MIRPSQIKEQYLISGIYSIKNVVNGHTYIGSAKNIYRRFHQHLSLLKNNKHINKHLQSAWNKYGKDNFIFQGLVDCEVHDLQVFEQFFIDVRNPEYNICRVAGSTRGLYFSTEHREKLSNVKLGKGKIDVSDKVLKSPKGEMVSGIECLKTFCDLKGIDSSHMYKVIKGIRKSHKGWSLC